MLELLPRRFVLMHAPSAAISQVCKQSDFPGIPKPYGLGAPFYYCSTYDEDGDWQGLPSTCGVSYMCQQAEQYGLGENARVLFAFCVLCDCGLSCCGYLCSCSSLLMVVCCVVCLNRASSGIHLPGTQPPHFLRAGPGLISACHWIDDCSAARRIR